MSELVTRSIVPNIESFLQETYVQSNDLSGEVSDRVSADNVLSTRIDTVSNQVSVLSQQVSVLSQQVSVISAGLGGVQLRVASNVQGISATALANISGLSASVASAAVYQIEGMVLYRMSVADTVGFGLTFPTGVVAGVRYQGTSAVGQGAGVAAFGNEDASGSIVYSVIPAAAVSTNILRIDGVFQVSTTAGIVQLQARVSATANPVNIQAGSYLRAYKIK